VHAGLTRPNGCRAHVEVRLAVVVVMVVVTVVVVVVMVVTVALFREEDDCTPPHTKERQRRVGRFRERM
jgi:heme/copper-type cytochrome/quinol oxidase subunit 2